MLRFAWRPAGGDGHKKMPLLEEVDESPGGSPRDAESLKAEHRRKRAKASASKSRKKKRAEVRR